MIPSQMVIAGETGKNGIFNVMQKLTPLIIALLFGTYEPSYSQDLNRYASMAMNGNIYFSRFAGEDKANIFCSRPRAVKYTSCHPFISPNESFVLFNILDHPDCKGAAGLFTGFHNRDDSWRAPINQGEGINTEASKLCPTLTHDGRYLFFSRLAGNTGNIYWSGSEIIQKLITRYPGLQPKDAVK